MQLLTTRSMALSMSKAKRYRLVTILSWWLEGWLNWICSQQAIQNLSGDNNAFPRASKGLVTFDYQ